MDWIRRIRNKIRELVMMKNTFVLILGVAMCLISFAQTPCIDGFAGIYPCNKVDLLSSLTTDEIGGAQNQNDIWGWTSATGREFAIVCKSNGTAFVEVSDPVNPVYLGDLPTKTTSSLWRDAKVYGDYAFIVSEAPGHGIQIFDMTQLLNLEVIPSAFDSTNTIHYSGFGNAHNIVINEDSGRAYGVGTDTFFGGLHIVDISDPLNPTITGSFAEDGYTHDAQIVNYHGPDLDYCDKEIAFNSNEDAVTIVDVTDPQDAYLISTRSYSDSGYTHQCWLSLDHEYLFVNDERDELLVPSVTNTTTLIWDVRDLDNPILVDRYVGETTAIDHNLYVKYNQIFASNYRAGLRILETSKAYAGELNEIGYFDSQPADDIPQFSGTWSNYPYFESGIVVMTDMYGDFFVLQPRTISADFNQTISLGEESAEYNVYFTSNEDAEVNVANLPDGILVGTEEVNGIGANTVTLFDLADLPAGTYDFDIVVSINGTDEVFPAELIVEETLLDAITLLGPSDALVNNLTPEFTWEANFEAGNLLLEVSTTPVFDNIVLSFEVSDGAAEAPSPLLEGEYFWRLSTIPVCNEPVLFSEGGEFAIIIVNINEVVGLSLSVYPNPVQDQLQIEADQIMDLTLTDAVGREVMSFTTSAGVNQVDVSALPSGVYLLNSSGLTFAKVIVE